MRAKKGDLFRDMVASNPDRMSYVDREYIYREVNHAYVAAYQCSRIDIVGRHVADIMGKETFEKTIKPHFDACLAGERVRYRDWFDFGTLGRRYVDVIYNPSRDAAGKINGVLVTARDFTEARLSELALQEARSRLELIFATIEDVIWITDWSEKKVLFVSAAYERIWGHPIQELYENGESWLKAVHPDDYARVRKAFIGIGEGRNFDEDYRIVRPDGTIRWIHDRGHATCDPQNRTVQIAGIAEDITSQKHFEEVLSKERQRLNAFLNNSAVVGWMKDAEGRYVFLSKNYETRFQACFEEWCGRTDFDVWPREIADQFRRNDLIVLQSQRPIECIEKAIDPDGRASWWLISKFPFEDQDGLRYVGGLGVDITERILADEERQKFEFLAENSQDFIGICDLNLVPFYVNAAGLRLVGLDSLQTAPQVRVPDFFFPEDRPFILSEFLPRVERDDHGEVEIRFRHFQSGESIWVLYNVFKLRNKEGVTTGWATVSRNITEQKRAEEAKRQLEETISHTQKLDAIGRLAAGMAHDFNSMLMVIRGNVDIIRLHLFSTRKRDDRLLGEAIERVTDAVDHGKLLLDKLLTYGRVRSPNRTHININAVVADTMRLVNPLLGGRIFVEEHLQGDLELCEGDGSQLQQVVLNLVMNARDAMPTGGTLTIVTENADISENYAAARAEDRPGKHVVLTVSDTGIGMDAETQKHLFEPFFSTKPVNKGTGLGLSIVHAVIMQAGGHITVQSEPGKGATFRVFLPAVLNR
ncbi:MAG: PAS domain S-box protein [Planctomycetes bacterium]|nr:PAS domain S-box protein [Planctomycetota bacterium]MBI3834579.1 PAS domain S-box protein [Planctomycetota bacterium]